MDANCPSCGGALKKMPQRKTKCPHCGQFMFVRSTSTDLTRRIVTAARAEEIERAWRGHFEQGLADEVAGMFDMRPGLPMSAVRSALMETVQHGRDRAKAMLAASQLARLAESDVQRDAAHRWYYAHQLMDMVERGVKTAVIRGGLDACPACQAQAGREMPIADAIERLVPSPRCESAKGGRVCCAFWSPGLAGNPYEFRRTL